jgi:putative ABC transport system permease protein
VKGSDLAALAGSALREHPLRSALSALGIAIGIAAVTVLTAIGEGLHAYVLAEFTQFGTNLVSVAPGKTTTSGPPGGVIANVRPLRLADAQALRAVPGVQAVTPMVQGNAQVEAGKRTRRATVFGVGPDMPRIWNVRVESGRFLPDDPPATARAYAVLGAAMARELFPEGGALGARVRVEAVRLRVIGVMEPKGRFLGFDLDDTLYLPAALGLEIFDRESLMEVNLKYAPGLDAAQVAAHARRILIERHGAEDFTVTTQDEMLDVLGTILGVLTFAVAALGGISLAVGSVGILTVMIIAVGERTAEIGLLRALGATRALIGTLFLAEATALATAGALGGLAAGLGAVYTARALAPGLPVQGAWGYVAASLALSAVIGLLAGVAPALRAARVDPVQVLRAE